MDSLQPGAGEVRPCPKACACSGCRAVYSAPSGLPHTCSCPAYSGVAEHYTDHCASCHALALQVLVQIHWAGINGGCETFRVRQEYAFARGATSTAPVPLGAEGAGVVVATGPGVTKLKVGSMGSPMFLFGAPLLKAGLCC